MKNFSPRMILWLVFAFSTLWLWSSWQAQHTPVVSAPMSQISNIANGTTAASQTPVATELTLPKGQVITLENDVLRLKINTQGGVVEYAELLKHRDAKDKSKNEVLFTTQDNRIYMSRSGLINKELAINNETMYNSTATESVMKDGQDNVSVALSGQNNDVVLNKTYTLKRGSYLLEVNHEVVNNGETAIEPSIYLDLTRDGVQADNSMFYSTFTGAVVYNDDKKFKKISFDDISKGKDAEEYTKNADNGWVGMLQHYFVSAWVLPNNEKRAREFYTRKIEGIPQTFSVGEVIPMGSVAPVSKAQLLSQLYVGPQDQQILGAVAIGLERSVDYGWATMISEPIHWIMSMINKVIPNWGWTIVALTILVKLILFPLNAASFKSMAKMKLLAPRLKQLQEQYGDDKMKLNQAMMALYKEEKVNPAGGCLPMLIQMPVFLALYYVLQAAVEVRGAPWIGWIHDLSLPDPLYILPVVMMVTMLVQTKLNPKPADPMQAKMMLFMPLIFGVTFFWFPSGLVLYWVVSNIFSIVQQWYMNKKFGIKESLISLKDE